MSISSADAIAAGSTEGAAARVTRVVGALLLVGLLSSCRQVPTVSSQHRRWADALIHSLNSHRLEQFGPLFGAHATYEDPLTNGVRSGPSLAYFWVTLFTAFPSAHYEITQVSDTDQLMVVEWVLTGFGGAAAATVNGVFLIELKGDALDRVRAYFDARLLWGAGKLVHGPSTGAAVLNDA